MSISSRLWVAFGLICYFLVSSVGWAQTAPPAPASSSPDAPTVLRHRPLLRGFGGLCDGGPIVCTRIDQIAFHAGADAIILPSTSLRDTGFFTSYGFSFGILERIEGGIFSSTAIWGQKNGDQTDTLWQQGPVRFSVKGLLWPWRKNPHQHFTVLMDFEYEARLPHFDGQNQLGLLTDLAALRAVGNLPLGLAEVGLSAGALFDGRAGYATPELGVRVGFHLPFLTDTKVFAEGLIRGIGAWVKTTDPIPGALIPAKPIVPSGALAFGLVTRPRRQVDFAMVAHVGFGDVAPFFFTVRGPLDFSLGEGYPYPQSLIVDILRETGEWIAEQRRKLSEPLQQTCMLYGRDGQPIAAMGHLSEDGEHCEFQGQHFRIGDTLYPDPARRQVCLEPEATHCVGTQLRTQGSQLDAEADDSPLASPGTSADPGPGSLPHASRLDPAVLQRLLAQGALGPIRGWLDDRCILNEGEHAVSPIGHLSSDGKYCVIDRDVNIIKNGKKLPAKVQQVPIPIGKPVYRDATTGRLCLSKNTKSNKDCLALLDVEHNHPLSSGTEAGYHGAIATTDWAQGKADWVKGTAHLLTNPAELTTAALKAQERAVQAGKKAVETLRDPDKAKQAARDAWNSTVEAARAKWEAANNWYNLPTQKKINSAVEGSVKGGLDLAATVAVGAVVPGGTGLTVAEEAVGKDAANGAAHLLEEASEVNKPALLPKNAPDMRGKAAPPTVDPRTGQPVGRFITDNKGNVLIEPAGGRTVAAGKGGVDTHTLYPNGSNYQRLNPKGHDNNPNPHGHGHQPGTGPGKNGQGPSLDPQGNVVPFNSKDAHWPIH